MPNVWQDKLLDLAAPVYKPRRDARRAQRVYRRFDEDLGFRRYREICQAQFTRQADAVASPLATRGVLHLPVLAPAEALDLRERITSGGRAANLKKGRPLPGFPIADPVLRRAILAAVLSRHVDGYLLGYFGSEYLVYWWSVTVTPAAPRPPSVSFRWHCDKGPRTHLKLIVYLDGSAEHGGNTEFVPLDDTAAVARRGYLFGRVRHRTGDLDELAALAGRPLTAVAEVIPAGGGVVFQPAAVLHRGLTPRRGTRHTVTLCLLPSPVAWQEAIRRGVLADLSVAEKWPRHADDLQCALGVAGCAAPD